MHVLIVIGAGASYDSWPKHVHRPPDYESRRLPLANALFSPLPTQDQFLDKYSLMGIASPLRLKANTQGNKFDIEAELAKISETANKRSDSNTIQNLFKARFYLHSVIGSLTHETLAYTHSHTAYVDLLAKLKDWIDGSPQSRFVDIVVFNYDNLIERAMENVYGYDWNSKNAKTQLSAYYSGKNLRIYKPHGSINWGREILKDEIHHFYYTPDILFNEFDDLELTQGFQIIDPNIITNESIQKNIIPAIAVPFKEKTSFEECPQEMQLKMLMAVNNADKVITLGWKGADKHFTDLLTTNKKIDEIYVISPKADTLLGNIFPLDKIIPVQSSFSYFVSETVTLESILKKFD